MLNPSRSCSAKCPRISLRLFPRLSVCHLGCFSIRVRSTGSRLLLCTRSRPEIAPDQRHDLHTWVFNAWFLGRPEIADFCGLGGPGGHKDNYQKWGGVRPPHLRFVFGVRHAEPSRPQASTISGRPKTMYYSQHPTRNISGSSQIACHKTGHRSKPSRTILKHQGSCA